jgi:drug/metabolite transporter (DMT)-like permease
MNKGALYMLLSSISFAIVNFGVKLLGGKADLLIGLQHFPAHELVFFRCLISIIISVYVIRKKKLPLFGNNKKWLLARGIFGVTALTLFFYTIYNLPLAIATTVQYLSPIFTVIIAIFLLKEKVKPIQWLFFGLAFVGVIVIALSKLSNGTESAISIKWILIGILSAIISGLAYNSIMKCRETDAPINIVIYFPLVGAPIMGVWCLFDFTMPQGVEWLIILGIGIFTQIAQVCMTRAFASENASKIMPLKYLGAIYAVLIGLFFFNETLSFWVSIGIVFVLLGVVLNGVWKYRTNKAMIANR